MEDSMGRVVAKIILKKNRKSDPESALLEPVINDQKKESEASSSEHITGKETSPTTDKKPITVGAVRLALYEKIKNFQGGGIEGVWRAIDPQFRNEDKPNPNEIKGIKRKGKMRHGAFVKQVKRFEKSGKSSNEKITFTVKNSSLLLLNVFEILGIKSINDLLGKPFQKEDIDTVNRETNINSREILSKLNEIHDILVLSKERNKRFTVSKVCNDFEDILMRLHDVIDNKPEEKKSKVNDIVSRSFILSDEQHQIAKLSQDIINNYSEYYSQDILLHKYSEIIQSTNFSDSNKNIAIFKLSPLYILYFFITVNRKFLSLLISSNNVKNVELFADINILNNKNIHDFLDGKSVGKDILDTINDIHRSLNYILSNMDSGYPNIPEEKYQEYNSLLKGTVNLFYNIYANKAIENIDWLSYFNTKGKNLNNFNFALTIGLVIRFIPSVLDIEEMKKYKVHLEKTEEELRRENIFLSE
jgi:hypothetical protein